MSKDNTSKNKKAQALVTGASGFIGRRLCQALLDSGCGVQAMGRRKSTGPWSEFLTVDLAGEDPNLDLGGIDRVFHLASKAHAVSERPGDDSGYRQVITDGTRRFVEAAEKAGVKSLIYLSSVKAMGEGDLTRRLISENEANSPQTAYGRCKLEAEKIVLASRIPHVVVLRPAMVYGPGQKGNLVRMAEAIRKRRFPPVRDNGNRRSMVHVDDLVEACLAATAKAEANRETFLISGNQAPSTRVLYDTLREEMGLAPVRGHFPDSLLLVGAKIGDLLGCLLRRKMPLDTDTFGKLVGSAWYSNAKSKKLLELNYANERRPYLEE